MVAKGSGRTAVARISMGVDDRWSILEGDTAWRARLKVCKAIEAAGILTVPRVARSPFGKVLAFVTGNTTQGLSSADVSDIATHGVMAM